MKSRTLSAAAAVAAACVLGAAACSFPSVTFEADTIEAGISSPRDAAAEAAPLGDDEGGPDADPGDGGVRDATPLPDGACDLDGTWATRITIDVTWSPQGLTGFILAPGTGQIRQWVKGVRTQNGTALSDDAVVCGVELPDFKGTLWAGGETYGVRFPDSLFDNHYLPTFTVSAMLSDYYPGATYSTETIASLLGLSLPNPTTDTWPFLPMESDMDQDGKQGVTAEVAQGPGYSDIPVGVPAAFQPAVRANKLYLAIREVTIITGALTTCNEINGTAQIPSLGPDGGKPAIDSHVMGCALDKGGDCDTTFSITMLSQAEFVDNTQPVFTPAGTSDVHSIRMKDGATCADVRQALP